MPVSDTHKLYDANLRKWELVRDNVEGSQAIKTRGGGQSESTRSGNTSTRGTRYLPKPNPDDQSDQNATRYAQYLLRANFVNFTGHTKDGFLGMVYRKKPEIELNTQIEFLTENADGKGLSTLQMLQGVTGDVLEVGRHGLLVDFPFNEGGTDAQTGHLQSKIVQYEAETIINWRTEVFDGVTKLTLVVLVEVVEKVGDDGFGAGCVKNYRVLRMVDRIYTQQMYDEHEDPIEDEFPIFKSDGSAWDEIPFVFVGSMDNSPTPDKAPLYDLAEINIAHYRNSADFEESSFLVGQPTPVITGLTQTWADKVLKTGIHFGSRTAMLLPVNADAKLLQADPNQMPGLGMEVKEKQMIRTGAKVITDSTGVETAEAAKIRFAGQNSKLSLAINNIERAFLQCFEWAAEFMTGDSADDNVLEINRQFYEATVDPQLLVASMQLMDRGVIGKTDLRTNLRKVGQIASDRTDEDIDAEVGSIDPLT